MGPLFVVFVAYGCYSSVAPTAKIDLGELDADLPVDPGPSDACVARRPWEGPGITGLLPIGDSTALVISRDRYYVAEFDTASTDASTPELGRVKAWRESGMLSDLWSGAPAFVGFRPWEGLGVTATYLAKSDRSRQIIISGFRRWVHQGNDWPAVGSIVDDWLIDDAGPTPVEGRVPWQGEGVTAAFFSPSGNDFFAVSKDTIWPRRTSDPDPNKWRWIPDAGYPVSATSPFSSAPAVGGRRPHEGPGVTAAFYVGPKLFVASVDRLWAWSGTAWLVASSIPSLSDWSSAPSAGCGGS